MVTRAEGMKVRQSWVALGLAVVLAGAPGVARAGLSADWNAFAEALGDDVEDPSLVGPDEDAGGVYMAVAMFEAANAVSGRYRSYLGVTRAAAGADATAAANEAARLVLEHAYPRHRAKIEAFAKAHDGPAAPAAREAGHDAGRLAAAAMLKRPVLDPARKIVPYRPETTPGHWVPTALPTLLPYFATERNFVVDADQAVPPPPSPASAAFARDFEETRTLGRRESAARTKAQADTAVFWANYTSAPALREAEAHFTGLDAQCRFFALVAVAQADAGLAMVRAKMRYMAWRPITAIRLGDITGNPALKAEADWVPLLRTPMHPEYPCGHCTAGGGLSTLLASVPGVTAETRFSFRSLSAPGKPTRQVTLGEYRRDVSLGRIWGGVHFRSSMEAGDRLGESVAREVLAKFAPGV